jgi:hypothetical protein
MIEAIDRLPRTFCHHDAFRRNLMARVADDGHEQTAAIDWAYTGIGAVGEEIGTLVSVGIQFMEVDVAQAVDLDEVVFEGYLAGLHDAGWRGDPRLVRLGFAATSALFMGIGGAGGCLQFILADDGKMIENVVGYPIDQILDQWAIMQNYLLDLGDEALMLIDKIG